MHQSKYFVYSKYLKFFKRTTAFLLVVLVLMGFYSFNSLAIGNSVLERVKDKGSVHCGSASRPGLAELTDQGDWRGLNVDICRAISIAILGSNGSFKYHQYNSQEDFELIKNQQDDVYFLTGSEIRNQNLAGKLIPISPIFIESHAVMVPDNSPVQHLNDLSGRSICFLIGTSVERSLESYFEFHGLKWLRQAFSEESEMIDSYNVQHCQAIAGEITTLAGIRSNDQGINHLSSRILTEPLLDFPILATVATKDGQWAAIVGWALSTLISAERNESRWYANGVKGILIEAPELGFDPQWQYTMLTAVGHYGNIFERNLGQKSTLKLNRALNINQFFGGSLISPLLE